MKSELHKILGLSTLIALTALVSGCGQEAMTEPVTTVAPPEGSLITADGTVVDADSVTADRVGLYFSALWCPPCRDFTPLLVDAYNELNADGKAFEVVFVSADRDHEAMMRYMAEYEMPWLAVPFADAARTTLPRDHQVRGIPRLVILDGEGNVVVENAVSQVRSSGAAAFANW